MTDEAEKEASEVLHSLLAVERIENTNFSLNKNNIISFQDIDVGQDNYPQSAPTHVSYQNEHATTSIKMETNESPNTTTITSSQKSKKIPKQTTPKSHEENEHNLTKLEDSISEVADRLKLGCECNQNCLKNWNAEIVYKHRLNIAELTKTEHDMYLMGVTMACLGKRTETSRNKERIHQRASYVYQGRKVCLDAFLYLENVTHYHLKRIRSHILTHGVSPRVHGNSGKKPHNTFAFDIYKGVEIFLKEFLKQYSNDLSRPITVTNHTRSKIYGLYKTKFADQPNEKLMGFTTFRHFMKKQFPNVKFVGASSKGTPVKERISLKKSSIVKSLELPVMENVEFIEENSNGESFSEGEQGDFCFLVNDEINVDT